jgi:hypothetical protein
MLRSLVLASMSLALLSHAADPKLKGSKKETAPKLDLGIPAFKDIPKDQKLEKPKEAAEAQQSPSGTRADEGYTVVRVVHGKSFLRSPDGAKPSAPFSQVTVAGNPLATEKFSSVIRVKSPAKKNTRIEVAILDQRGDTVMEASGEIRFGTGEEAEWQVDWDPTGVRNAGEFQVLVRIGGNPLGTFPLKVVSAAAAPPTPSAK